MKILFAIKALDDIKGGAERVLAAVSAGLAQHRHDVTVVTFDQPGGKSFYPLDPKVRRIALGIGDAKSKSGAAITAMRIKDLRETITKEKPEIVIAFMHSMFIPMALALIGTGIPVIASEHIVPQHYRERKIEYALLILCGLLARRMTVLSAGVRDLYPKILRGRMAVIANPVYEAAGKADPAANTGRKIILNVGRLDPQKDQVTLIAAFAKLAGRYPDWDLRIVGEGALKGSLKKKIEKLGLQNRVTLVGAVQDIGSEYMRAHIFALSSLYESFGLATAEAMSYGLPVIGFADCSGTNELVDDGVNGLLAPESKDREAVFSSCLEQLMESDVLRAKLGRQGIETARQFAPEKIIAQWEELIAGSVAA